MRKLFLIPILLLFILSCSDINVKDLVIKKENKDEIVEKVKKGKDLTGEEVGLFLGAMARASISGNQSIEGKTARELINDQRKVVEDEKAKEAEAKRLINEAKRKEELIAKELSEYILVVPIKKYLKRANFYRGEYKDRIVIELALENKGEKDIRAFKGKTVFKNLFGEDIFTVVWYCDEGLKSKEKKRWVGSIEYNQFDKNLNKFVTTELENMKSEWIPIGIIFKDGNKFGLEESSRADNEQDDIEAAQNLDVERMAEKIRSAHLNKDMEKWLSCYTLDYPKLSQLEKSILELWRSHDVKEVAYRISDVQRKGESQASAMIVWTFQVYDKRSRDYRLLRQSYRITLENVNGDWKIKDSKEVAL